jgi:pimeloyl-ACP methyl ester carboxylesterase
MKRPSGVRYGYANSPFGQLHFAEAGSGPPLLCLHQTPRSCDEFAELMPLLCPHFRVIAMDTLGMGASAPPSSEPSIELYAAAAVALLDSLEIQRTHIIGHHTGGVIAIELAARHGHRVNRLVLTSTPYVDASSRERRKSRKPIDFVEVAPDGSHLMERWRRRQSFYPQHRPDILERCAHDALSCQNAEEGHLAVSRYEMETVLDAIVAPTLCIGATADPYAYGELEPLASRIAGAKTAVIEGGTVGLLEDKAEEVAAITIPFLQLP